MQSSNVTDYELIGSKMIMPGILAAIVLSILISYSYYWNINNIHEEKLSLALAEAKANWDKDASFRRWATLHGGLYVKPSDRTPPNPYLAHLPNRDVVTTNGIQLTLMNPAYMMRQMTEEFEEHYGVKGKITGKIQLNPLNKPDEWEDKALDLFEKNSIKSIHEQQIINGEPYLRYMKPMYMTAGCVKCHGHFGFNQGDLRGGVSVSIPLTPYFLAAAETGKSILITHVIVWAIGMAAILIFSLVIRKLLAHMARLAMHDGLTKLPNMNLFKNRLEQVLKKFKREPKYHFAVCFMDLDRFKNLNDSHGHTTGDQLLIQLSDRLTHLLRPGDTIARMGGDEFILLLDNIDGLSEALSISERVLSSFERPFHIGDTEIFSNASIGICLATNVYNHGDDMIRDADIAMYRAKTSGKGKIDVFNPEMHVLANEDMQIENDLRTAIQKQQLAVHYQPIIDIENNCIDGFEALLRWVHPHMGFISPERFISIAEKTGQINTIGKWILEQACSQVHEWSLKFNPEKKFNIAINLSGEQLTDKDFYQTLEEILNTSRIDKTSLHLEVTETVLIRKQEKAQQAIEKLQKAGLSVNIDDFGKGCCSLTYLQQFNFDSLKIDKDFVQDMGAQGKELQLVKTLMLLARDFKMKVIAKGVETKDQLNLLKAMKCPYIQGYYYSRPLSKDNIQSILTEGCHLNANLLLKNKTSIT